MQRYLAEASAAELERRGVRLAEAWVLELGAGQGGYSRLLAERAKRFLAADISFEIFAEKGQVPFQVMDVQQPFPLRTGSIDLIYSSSLIEHLAEPQNLIREAFRVLRPGGRFYLSFPPFYSLALVGGHIFKPFHFLGEKTAVWLYNKLHGARIADYASSYGPYGGLYPLTIRQVKEMLLAGGFVIEDLYTRMSRLNTARLPGLLADLFTWHACFLARRP